MRLGILSDAHGNAEAFRLGREILQNLGADEIYFLGDAVGYLPGTSVVEDLVASGIPAIRGNHETMLLTGGSMNGHDDVYQLRSTGAAMSSSLRAVITGWPASRELELASGRAVLVHGSPDDPTFGYVYPDSDLRVFAARPDLAGATVFMGNTHRPFVRSCGSTTFVNVGSCGLPRDVGMLGACCIYDDAAQEARILRFDIRDAVRRARQRCGEIHPLVQQVLERKAERYVGELVDV